MIPITSLDNLKPFQNQLVTFQTSLSPSYVDKKSTGDPNKTMYGYVNEIENVFVLPDSPAHSFGPYIKIMDIENVKIFFEFRSYDFNKNYLSLRLMTLFEASALYKKIEKTDSLIKISDKLKALANKYFALLFFIFGKSNQTSLLYNIPKELIYIIVHLYSQVQNENCRVEYRTEET